VNPANTLATGRLSIALTRLSYKAAARGSLVYLQTEPVSVGELAKSALPLKDYWRAAGQGGQRTRSNSAAYWAYLSGTSRHASFQTDRMPLSSWPMVFQA